MEALQSISIRDKEANVSYHVSFNNTISYPNLTYDQEILTTLPEYYAHTLVYIWVAPFLIFIGTVGK